jgi:hypothetical protein
MPCSTCTDARRCQAVCHDFAHAKDGGSLTSALQALQRIRDYPRVGADDIEAASMQRIARDAIAAMVAPGSAATTMGGK